MPVSVGDHGFTLDCAGALKNPGPARLLVVALGVRADGGQGPQYTWELDPGAPAAHLPDPPAGGWWAIGTETVRAANERAAWAFGALVLLGGFAGLGVAEWLYAVWHRVRRW